MTQSSHFIDRARAATDPIQQQQIYNEWAGSYDVDLDALAYVGPQSAALELARFLPDRGSLILDAGCGSGRVGLELQRLGYHTIHGADISPGMMEIAGRRGCYQKLFPLDLTEPFPPISTQYDAIISVGVLGRLIPVTILGELLNITKPEGILCLTVRDNYQDGRNYRATIKRLEEQGLAKLRAEEVREYIMGEAHTAPICMIQKR